MFCDRNSFVERLIFENDYLYIIASVGQIEDGYTLIIPKTHKICLGDLSDEEMIAVSNWLRRLLDAMKEEYMYEYVVLGRRPVFFEHGDVGQTIKHAHLHVVPTHVDVLSYVAKSLGEGKETASLNDLRKVRESHRYYIFCTDRLGKMFVFPVSDPEKIPRQYLRLVLAKLVGRPERANWKTMDMGIDFTLWSSTRDRLRPYFLEGGC